jgi:8-oxo-dGTP pyrophosphatase MutT (NUDIX family)
MSSNFERVGSETVYDGKFISVVRGTFRHEDGAVVTRELVHHPGAVGVVVLDERQQLWFVRQPREPIGVPDLLEIPAGKLDVEGEDPLEAGRRELAEEIGKQAAEWTSLGSFHTSVGFADEVIHLFLATGVSDVPERPAVEEDERIDVEVRPLAELDSILTETSDAKTLIALYRLRDHLSRP